MRSVPIAFFTTGPRAYSWSGRSGYACSKVDSSKRQRAPPRFVDAATQAATATVGNCGRSQSDVLALREYYEQEIIQGYSVQPLARLSIRRNERA